LLRAVWAEPIGGTGVQTIELLAQPDGEGAAVVTTAAWGPREVCLSVTLPIPSVKTRYRWRFMSVDGVVQQTEYSQWVEPLPAPVIELKVIGGAA
ncbi:MAG: hypothetical protein R3C45_19950, partial [Phycisphaerales bacterium]